MTNRVETSGYESLEFREQATIMLALQDRIRYLDTLGENADAVAMKKETARLLAKLGDIVGIQVRHYYPLPFPEPTVRKANAVRDAYEKASTAE